MSAFTLTSACARILRSIRIGARRSGTTYLEGEYLPLFRGSLTVYEGSQKLYTRNILIDRLTRKDALQDAIEEREEMKGTAK